jgi:hypothetical protein
MLKIETLVNHQIVVIALSQIGGDSNFIDTEDIAIRVNQIAPGRFNWKKYPENIDLKIVSVSLFDARKPRLGGLVVGDTKIGWMLTPDGLKWIDSLGITLEDFSIKPNYRKDSTLSNLEEEKLRLKSTTAYKLFHNDELENATLQDAYNFLRINEYYQVNSRKKRFLIVENAVSNDQDLSNIWKSLKDKFFKEGI